MSESQAPVINVTGNPTDAELAAVVAVLTALGGGAETGPGRARISAWADPSRQHGRALRPGSGAWSATSWPTG